VFVNVVGGVRIDEPGADLAVALAVASAARGVATDPSPLACFGEIGLTGELRSVAHPDRRAQEAAKFGLAAVVSPAHSRTLREAVQTALSSGQRAQRAA
jgi:DNA repair protein RadA/Sms